MKNFVELNNSDLQSVNGGNTTGGGQGSGTVAVSGSTIAGGNNTFIGAINTGNWFYSIMSR